MFNINIKCVLPSLWKILGAFGKKRLLTGVQNRTSQLSEVKTVSE